MGDRMITLSRGDIWFVDRSDLGDVSSVTTEEGEEVSEPDSLIRKTRPYVVVQADAGRYSPIILCAPIMEKTKRTFPFLQKVMLLKQSEIHYEHICPIPRHKFISKVGKLNEAQIMEMDMKLAFPLNLCESSILHIQRIELGEIKECAGSLTYQAKMVLRYYTSPFTFTKESLLYYSGMDENDITDRKLVESWLTSLHGLKFAYARVKEHVESVSAQML